MNLGKHDFASDRVILKMFYMNIVLKNCYLTSEILKKKYLHIAKIH
jgi:hypothetical protein